MLQLKYHSRKAQKVLGWFGLGFFYFFFFLRQNGAVEFIAKLGLVVALP